MIKTLRPVGNSLGLIIDRPILELRGSISGPSFGSGPTAKSSRSSPSRGRAAAIPGRRPGGGPPPAGKPQSGRATRETDEIRKVT